MELPLRLQAAQFAAALLFGLLCGVVYDLLRAPRRRIPALTVPADLLYALFLLLGLLALALYVGGGRLRLFFYPERGAGRCRAGFAAFALAGTKIFENFPYFFQKVLCKCEKMVYNIR